MGIQEELRVAFSLGSRKKVLYHNLVDIDIVVAIWP